ncbi:MAG: hypothetical protein RL160_1892 [Bacteroidota bacterium]
MERLNIYLEMLHDYMHTRDHYSFWTMEEYATLNDFDWYLSHSNRNFHAASVVHQLPELAFLNDLYGMCSLRGSIADGVAGIEHINTRIALLVEAIELLIIESGSKPSCLAG